MNRGRLNRMDSLVLLNEQSSLRVENGRVKVAILPRRKKIWKEVLTRHEENRPKKMLDL